MDWPFWRRWAVRTAGCALLLVAGATAAAHLGRVNFLLNQASHFRAFYLVAATGLTVAVLLLRSWRWALVGAALVAVNATAVMPYYWPRTTPVSGSSLRVLVSNVMTTNPQHYRLRRLVREERPDVIALTEVGSAWSDALALLEEEYPYRILKPQEDHYGIALFSRLPFTDGRVIELDEPNAPAISIRLNVAGRPVTFLVLHARMPGTPGLARRRDRQLRRAAAIAHSEPNPVIVCGDFNTTPWAPAFKDMLADSGLNDARRGFGLQCTWPVQHSPFLIPIDHCLVSPEIGVRSFRALEGIGSDHFPLLVELAMPDGG